MKSIHTLIFLFFAQITFAQTATIQIVLTHYDNEYEHFNEMIFSFNGVTFPAMDTTPKKIKLNKTGFDQCYVTMNGNKSKFLTKFHENESYIINPGCCCAAFSLKAANDPMKGMLRFNNCLPRDIIYLIGDANSDTLKAKETSEYAFAWESMMCFFKPVYVLLAEPEYNNEKYAYDYDYKNENKTNYDSLWEEQKMYQIAYGYFHFLHGEKVTVSLDEKNKQLLFKLDGYMTKEEYDTFMK